MHRLCRPYAGRTDTSDSSPYRVLLHLFMDIQLLNHTSDIVEVALVISSVSGDKGRMGMRGMHTFLTCSSTVCDIFAHVLLPHSRSSQVLFSMTVSPHRHPPEQPGESPCIHRLITAEPCCNNYTNRHGCIPLHTHFSLNLTFHLCISYHF